MIKTLYWMTTDQRLNNNPALALAARHTDELAFVYIIESRWFEPCRFAQCTIGDQRWRFLAESIEELSHQLALKGQRLIIRVGDPIQEITKLCHKLNINRVIRSTPVAFNEQRQWERLQNSLDSVQTGQACSFTLYDNQTLPIDLNEFPQSFSRFKKTAEQYPHNNCFDTPKQFPPQISNSDSILSDPIPDYSATLSSINGGEISALEHMSEYFSTDALKYYKQTRNELSGWSNSSKFSAWLSIGNISVQQLFEAVCQHQALDNAQHDFAQTNQEPHWLLVELLWREFFQWYAVKYQQKLFQFKGLNSKNPLTTFYPERFKRWSAGETPFPIVNACMKELNQTGYLSNRGRQLVASCLINELELDWRYGAAYFEQKLIDYDPSINWGNWQYIAGVGADPRGGRHFNLQGQTEKYDPEGKYIETWTGHTLDEIQTYFNLANHIDNRDIVDWPI